MQNRQVTEKINYTKNYLKIYLWRSLSIISGFLSLLIVIPHLSNNKELYGIYSFCISFTLYLTYADIGFLGAGQKYAAEAFAKGNRDEEMEIFGFTGAILLLMILPFSIGMIYFSFNPNLILNGLSIEGQQIASNIFLILGLLLPIQILVQRLVQSILIVRIKDYISLRIDIIFNLLKIASIYFFFSKGKYMIVEYFLFTTLLTIISSLIITVIIKKTEEYNFLVLIKSIRLSKKYYTRIKKLAFSSLFLTLGWLLYYELDIIIIGKWYGPEEVAIYAIGFTFLNFLRTLWNVVFSPYAQRFNHFSVTKSVIEMKALASKIIDYTFPLCVLTTLVLVLGSKYIVLFWVGHSYTGSIIILKLLILGTGFGFISQPADYYFMSKTKYGFINTIAIALPLSFIIGILILNPIMGIAAFALSKSIALFVGFIISIIGISSLISPMRIIGKWIINISVICGLLIIYLPKLLNELFPYHNKSSFHLFMLVATLSGVIILSYGVILLTKKQQRDGIKIIFNKMYARIIMNNKSS